MTGPLRVLVAPDKFKGTLTAAEVTEAIAAGLETHGVAAVRLPLADGGDGSVDAAVAAGYERVPLPGPDGASYALSRDGGGTAVVEVANTCGIALTGADDPLGASSLSFGHAVAQAVAQRPNHLVLALGGSASTDGGSGLLAALGYRLLDVDGAVLEPNGGTLCDVASVDAPTDHPLAGVEVTVASDVDNPLIGARGAAEVFAPQKGADADQVALLAAGLRQFVAVAARDIDPRARAFGHLPGSGAAGGLGFAALLLGARISSGAEFFLDVLGFDDAVASCDVVITGEGRLDHQTLGGKLPAVVVQRAAPRPVHLVVGRNDLGVGDLAELGATSVWALSDLTPHDSARDPELSRLLLAELGRQLGSVTCGHG